MRRRLRALLAGALCLLLGACSTMSYYLQAIEGHLKLMAKTFQTT